ncbi:hypothetical protein BDQ17DRAFT_382201 [Cyathus striatus]|nr:hypothetical protein BDQ17DRAFT_382201 [Cyathus striatus]
MHDFTLGSNNCSQVNRPSWPFFGLPQDLFEEILRHLDCVNLIHCAMACCALYDLIMTNSEFRYTIELGRQSLIDTSASGISYAIRLENLRRQRHAWSTLTWRNQFEVKTKISLEAYEMVDGHFSCIDHTGNFQLVHLPSGEDDTLPRVSETQLGLIPQDFTIDPGQDLVVFFVPVQGPLSRTEGRDVHIHLWTLSSYKPHPSAQNPLLSFFIPPDDMWANEVQMSSVQLVDDTLAVFYSTGSGWLSPRLLIWNWKLGILLTDSHKCEIPLMSWVSLS